MSVEISLGWWILPAIATIAAIWWLTSHDYSGDYNFAPLFTVPAAGFMICAAWMVYFGFGWALS